MVDIALLQSVSYIAGALGVCVAAAYYVLNLRLSMQTRKAQLLVQLTSDVTQKEWIKDGNTILSMAWTDFDDFARKYDSGINPENYATRAQHWGKLDALGYYVKKGLIDVEQANILMGGFYTIWLWEKYGPLIKRYREIMKVPNYYEYFEFLAAELKRFQRSKGYEITFDGSGVNYFPDKNE